LMMMMMMMLNLDLLISILICIHIICEPVGEFRRQLCVALDLLHA